MNQPSGRVLGIDYGSKRIGVAVSDPLNIIAQSIGVVPNNDEIFEKLMQFVAEYEVFLIIVGMPYSLGGEKGAKAKEVENFVEKLKQKVNVEVTTIDERFTSVVAQRSMLMMGTSKKQRRQKGKVDEMASALILQSYLDRKK